MRIKKGFTLRTVMGQNVILAEGNNSDNFGKIISLNDSAARLWENLRGKEFDVTDAADVLVRLYGITPDQAREDVAYIIKKMTDKGLLEI